MEIAPQALAALARVYGSGEALDVKRVGPNRREYDENAGFEISAALNERDCSHLHPILPRGTSPRKRSPSGDQCRGL
jgi:hypothetical protein